MVHQAPGFGEDDFRVCLKFGILKKGEGVVCPVDATGKFTDEVVDFKGQYVKVRVCVCVCERERERERERESELVCMR